MRAEREGLRQARRIVVKAGSRVLVQANGRPDLRRMRVLVDDIGRLRREGREVVLVSSGAVGAGMQALKWTERPRNLPDLQMAAAVGQSRLMATYDQLFSRQRRHIGQVLLTHADLNDRRRHLNARNTILNLLRNDVIPIINENDVVAVDEIRFGDNDALAALATALIDADVLVLLTTADGLRESGAGGRTTRVKWVPEIGEDTYALVQDRTTRLSTGGMASKLRAASTAIEVGASVVIAHGRKAGVLPAIFEGRDVGTLLGRPLLRDASAWRGRKKWIAFFHRAAGSLVVDDGARKALEEKGKSLLPIGIRDVIGEFDVGAVVNIRTDDQRIVARGLVEYSSGDIRRIRGHRTADIASILGHRDYEEVVHRDNMVLLANHK